MHRLFRQETYLTKEKTSIEIKKKDSDINIVLRLKSACDWLLVTSINSYVISREFHNWLLQKDRFLAGSGFFF